MDILISEVLKGRRLKYSEEVKLSGLSSIRVGGVADVAVFPEKIEELVRVVRLCNLFGIEYHIIGSGTNTLFLTERLRGVLISTRLLKSVRGDAGVFVADCGAPLAGMLSYAARLGYGGAEGLFHIPGTIGGAIRGNAGAFGNEIGDFLIQAEVYIPELDKIVIFDNNKFDFGYRYSAVKRSYAVVLSASFGLVRRSDLEIKRDKERFLEIRRASQPIGEYSLGSTYKRVGSTSAGYFIDKAGLKGYEIGGAAVSDKHAGFIINKSGASVSDVLSLLELIEETVYKKYGIILEREIEVVG